LAVNSSICNYEKNSDDGSFGGGFLGLGWRTCASSRDFPIQPGLGQAPQERPQEAPQEAQKA
jgi:hypothetical protein